MIFRALACLAVLFTTQTGKVESLRPALAPEIVKQLDRGYPGWRIAPLREDDARELPPSREANVARADFDGDGSVDVAVLIDYPVAPRASQGRRFMRAIVFLRRARAVSLTDPQPWAAGDNVNLSLIEKGTEGYDMNTDRTFKFERDAILLIREGACTSFVFRSGRFEGLWTCD
jgi:hypothetical protein